MDKIELKLNDSDKVYTLEYNRYSLIAMEQRGFDISKAEARPLSTLVDLSRGAFIMHHPEMKFGDIDVIVDQIGDKVAFVSALAEMYKNAVEALISDKKVGNATWGRA